MLLQLTKRTLIIIYYASILFPLKMKHSKTRVLSFQTHTNHQLRFLHPDSSEKSQNRDGEEDAALDLVMDRLKFYRKEYKRLLKENGELWEENQKIKASYNQLKVSTIFRLRLLKQN